ncbi:AMP-binding protein [Marinibaculum pumilum]|uniref:AMP-binding protein n=1 Tax=Marinibaculum pumilum TaxID=1766165 RepID=A0ABV7LB30_9PROT
MLPRTHDYDRLRRDFAWSVPERFNIGVAVCDRHARGDGRPALLHITDSGAARSYSFDEMRRLTNRFANALVAGGLSRGDRIGVFLPQSPETAIAHVAAFKAGMVSIPLFTLFGEDALEYRLGNSGAKALVTDLAGAEKIAAVRDRLPELRHVFVIGEDAGSRDNTLFDRALEAASDSFEPVDTAAEDPAVLMYTSGTTGDPKGALHAHRVLLGHVPAMEVLFDFLPQPDDLVWTPADWAWIAGLFDIFLTSWYCGVPVLARRPPKFDPEDTLHLMRSHRVSNAFLPPTALKMIRSAGLGGGPRLRTMFTGGEALDAALLDWVRETFGTDLHEAYGQTECNVVVGSNTRMFPTRPGSMGRAVPGHDVRIIDEAGQELPCGTTGFIGVRAPNPVMMLRYWNNPDATEAKYCGGFLNTGDLGQQDEDGYLWFVSRSDDIINSGGYRIGPGEIEQCLMRHPAIAMAAVVGIPDPVRTEAIKAWLVLNPGYAESESFSAEIRDFVRRKLAAHEYPRHIAVTDSLPMSMTGKIRRSELRARG